MRGCLPTTCTHSVISRRTTLIAQMALMAMITLPTPSNLDPAGWAHERCSLHTDPAPPRRERVEREEPVHRLGGCRPDRQGSGRSCSRRGTARREWAVARCGAYVVAHPRHSD